MDTSAFQAWVHEASLLITEHASRLTDLDAAIGDGDHGINLRRGFQAADEMIEKSESETDTPGAVLRTVGRALISKTGGASGPIYGTGFRQAGKALGDVTDVDAVLLGSALEAAFNGIQQLGAAHLGDKTLLDALGPAVTAYQVAVEDGGDIVAATRAAADAAERGLAETIPMLARKGRASYLGERTIGHEDPGAASTALIMRALATVAAGEAS
ncbi:dihydroxyacetone kinase subunit L [Asanoa ishikariensis]|uniref:Dihydroxyacetone kinase DhaL subunit n=1 Tax=Asanoa ishikariensis TaxID=137265 RepID=A0A1H3MV73_9ACTN|nr:dihydroxyacetone kinase subunit DhaL [Asanoa ishikariensis]GIF66366.1 dihydroxyacetone kinase subunit L [Asanoa ishikariensis]SDY80597.1 dihydroxyacetone kinase DhaL subunit [Asanoa ishikariensis]